MFSEQQNPGLVINTMTRRRAGQQNCRLIPARDNKFFPFSKTFVLALRPSQSHIQWTPVILFPSLKQPFSESDLWTAFRLEWVRQNFTPHKPLYISQGKTLPSYLNILFRVVLDVFNSVDILCESKFKNKVGILSTICVHVIGIFLRINSDIICIRN